MKRLIDLLLMVLIVTLVFAIPIVSYADKGSDDGSTSGSSSDSGSSGSDDPPGDDSRSGSDDSGSDDSTSDDAVLDDSSSSSLSSNPEYMNLVREKELLSSKIDGVKAQLDTAKDGADAALTARLETELRTLKNQKDAIETQMNQLVGDDRFKLFDSSKHWVETELDTLKDQRDAVERELIRLKTELSLLTASSDTAGQALLRQKIAEQEALKDSLQVQIREKKLAIRDLLRELYSDDEWNAAVKLQAELDKLTNVHALPINSIFVSGKEVKFDTPPVISSGRTLIPVRAIAASLGATVLWDEREQKITIQKGTTVIEFEIGDDSMKVNGTSTDLDVPPQIINGRTVIPLRAMVESLGLQVDWDEKIQVLEIQ